MTPILPERIERKIERVTESGCWIWMGYINESGYGHVKIKERTLKAHRAVYAMMAGSIPHGLTLDHLCRVRCCVNPSHREPVTIRDNLFRGETPAARNASVERCKQGHAFTTRNTYFYSGHRYCRECNRVSHAKKRNLQ